MNNEMKLEISKPKLITATLIFVIVLIIFLSGLIFNFSRISTDQRYKIKYQGDVQSTQPVLSPSEEYILYASYGFDGEALYMTFAILDNLGNHDVYMDNIEYIWTDKILLDGDDYIKWYDEKTVYCFSSERNAYFYVSWLDDEWKESGWIKKEDGKL